MRDPNLAYAVLSRLLNVDDPVPATFEGDPWDRVIAAVIEEIDRLDALDDDVRRLEEQVTELARRLPENQPAESHQ